MAFLPDTLRPIPESEPLGIDEVNFTISRNKFVLVYYIL